MLSPARQEISSGGPTYRATLQRVLLSGETEEVVMSWRDARDQLVSYTMQFVAERDAEGRVSGVFAVGRNIQALRAAEQQLFTIAEHSPDIICRYDREFRYLFASKAVEKMTGIPVDELIGRKLGERLVHYISEAETTVLGKLRHNIAGVFETGQAREIEMEVPLEGGSRMVNVRFVPEFGFSEGKETAETVLTITRDITEKWRAERDLASANANLFEVLESLTDNFMALDKDRRFTSVNRRAAESLGLPTDQLMGRSWRRRSVKTSNRSFGRPRRWMLWAI